MNILNITNSYMPNSGGMATAVHRLVCEIRNLGHGALVLTPQFDSEDGSDNEVLRLPLEVWDKIIGEGFHIENGSRLHQRILDFAPDIIHVHGPFHLGPVASRLADDMELPLVYTHHTKLEEYIRYCDCSDLTPKGVQDFYVGFANQCDMVLAPSGMEATNLAKLGVSQTVHVVPTGLSAEWFSDSALASSQNARNTIGIVGRVSEEKRSMDLARAAMAYLQSDETTDLVVVGDGDSLESIRCEAASLGLSDRIACTGFIDQQGVRERLAQLDVVINAPEMDTQCIVLLESQVCGVPVISSDVPLAHEYVCNFAEGITFYPLRDWQALTACLNRFFSLSPVRRVEIKAEALAFAASFEETKVVQDLCRRYEDLVEHYDVNESDCSHHRGGVLYDGVYRALTEGIVPVIQKLRSHEA